MGQRRRDISWEALGGVHAGQKIGLAGQDKDTCPQPNLVLRPAAPAPSPQSWSKALPGTHRSDVAPALPLTKLSAFVK